MSKPLEVFSVFLKLGLTSFGGPIAHIGYYQRELVAKRAWLTDRAFSHLVALCHFLPGPASSQTGMAIGYHRAGPLGAIAAFIGFTSPSAFIMVACALFAQFIDKDDNLSVLQGLELAAFAVVAQAILTMQATLCPDWRRRMVAGFAFAFLLMNPNSFLVGQISVMIIGGIFGAFFLAAPDRQSQEQAIKEETIRFPSPGMAVIAAIFAMILLILSSWSWSGSATLLAGITQAGALVFGGGHVVLPLLESVTSGWLDPALFLAGYGAAQALPGPLFSFAAYIGILADSSLPSLVFAVLCLGAIFIPGFLFLFATLPFWGRLSAWQPARAVMAGINASVVGLLAAALIDPLWLSAVKTPLDALVALAAFLLLWKTRIPVWSLVLIVALFCFGRSFWAL